ncbi:glycosyltransferase family 4 protein [Leptothoe sp. PORK10 BA2]|uniref:glycosyltransferase family 4 protein n=1 Tax=Leptothoe sp. PORK10 BA2 TaxID=3110254 RepID=UPI002B1FADDF|nr:glycosyltransferase family 1 protein [Leptothoe sp. PORK10 BA2]MEA5466115.1 glycosyltransferase family 1 protein [Leptothoe sp. PORK10 BA2]
MHVLIPALHRPIKPTGVCRHAVNLAQCLAATPAVARVTLIIGSWQRPYFNDAFQLDSAKIQLVEVDIKNSSLARNRWFLFGLPQLAKQLQPDMIHMSFPFPFVRQWFNSPIVSTIHDLYPYECPENFGYPRVWFNQLFLHQCIRNSDGLTCVSNCTLDALKDYFPQAKGRQKNTVVYNVVDFEGIHAKVPHQLLSQSSPMVPGDPFLMTVAQHRKNKNLDLLIRAYGTLRHRHQLQAKLLIVGSSGPETESLTQLVSQLNLEQQVLFLSGLSDGELRWLYENASLFVIPSTTEGFCLPLVEALTLACPAVCSDIPIFREVGSSQDSSQCHYFSLNGQDSTPLADAMAAALAADARQTQTPDNRFSKATISNQLLDFYRLF